MLLIADYDLEPASLGFVHLELAGCIDFSTFHNVDQFEKANNLGWTLGGCCFYIHSLQDYKDAVLIRQDHTVTNAYYLGHISIFEKHFFILKIIHTIYFDCILSSPPISLSSQFFFLFKKLKCKKYERKKKTMESDFTLPSNLNAQPASKCS